jgi:hypothetical protein
LSCPLYSPSVVTHGVANNSYFAFMLVLSISRMVTKQNQATSRTGNWVVTSVTVRFACVRRALWTMRCIVHIWKSPESGENTFQLRLTPLGSAGHSGLVEAFPNELLLSERMAELGLTNCICRMSISNLRYEGRVIWSNCEVAEDVLASFRRTRLLEMTGNGICGNNPTGDGVCILRWQRNRKWGRP